MTVMPLLVQKTGRVKLADLNANCDAFIGSRDRESVNLNGHYSHNAFITTRGRQSFNLNAMRL